MADDKITALPAAVAVATTDLLVVDDGVTTKKATVAQARAAMLPIALGTEVGGTLAVANQTAAGTNEQFTYNNGGVPAGAAGLTYDLSTTQARVSSNCGILFRNVANTFDGRVYWNVSTAQTVIFPDATGTVVLEDDTATLTNKTIVAASNTITDTSATTGDILRHNGTRFVRLARGSANQVLTTNAGATDIGWATPAAGSSPPTGTGYYHVTAGVMDAAAVSLTWTGDATGTGTGTSFALTVVRVNGATVPAAGALTTGHVLQASGASALSYGFVANANVSATAAIAGTKISPDFGAQNVVTTGALQLGTSPVAAAGSIRLPNAPTTIIAVRDGTNAADWRALSATAANLTVGDNANLWSLVELQAGSGGIAKVTGHDVQIFAQTTTGTDLEVNSQYVMWLKQDSIWAAQPIVGHTLNSSPYGVHGGVAVRPPSDANYALSTAEYKFDWIELDLANWTATHNVTVPAPATKAVGYYKTLYNINALRSATITAGAGVTVTIAPTQAQCVWIDETGVRKHGAPFSP